MSTPGFDTITTKLLISEKQFKSGDYIVNGNRFFGNLWDKIKYYTGCNPLYQSVVLDEPKMIGRNWEYTMKLYSKTYRIFYIKIYTKKLCNNNLIK